MDPRVTSLATSLRNIPLNHLDDAVQEVMKWLNMHSHAVCIFTPMEIETSSLRIKDVEEAMCVGGFDAIVEAGGSIGHDGEVCDHCGDEITDETRIVVPSLSQDIASANAGESAVLCLVCHMKVGA
jgi:hypothetical protein